MENKVALITGANKGIGLEIARQLGRQGITVVLGSRDAGRGVAAAQTLKADDIDAHFVKLDVTNAADIAALPDYFEKNFGRLDILVNNAGVIAEREGVTPEALRQTYEANVIAPYALTQALLPLLKASPASRIVNQSSALGSLTLNASGNLSADWLLPAYNSSKAALNMLTVIQAAQLKDTPLKVNAAHPGSVKTDLNRQGELSVEDGAKTAVTLATLPADGPTGGFFHLGETLAW
ncbi:MAG: SDR family oxidoreductase [Armatimonadota bacterium]|nr:SDR family oxidoreductase [Armatimonadota bacterium]